ncbi:MAG: S1 RNA-binding domain-containing protein [Oscillospiraceae bacterium]|jgi:4-hydroxy-3-methylbut-2-enyl diphosphate reductase|nr:S1 RNA-binding domain-containing protein [Oscillospiraceae bacterium]
MTIQYQNRNITFVTAKSAGFCGGVLRAVETVRGLCANVASGGKRPYIIGRIVHNNNVCAELERLGAVTVESPDEIPDDGIAVIRSHGEPLETYAELNRRGLKYVDLTCPNVKHIHDIVARETALGNKLIYIGDPDHPESKGILSRVKNENFACAVNSPDEFAEFLRREYGKIHNKNHFLVLQTTSEFVNSHKFISLTKRLLTELTNNSIINNVSSIQVYNTVCRASVIRREDVEKNVPLFDCAVVFGDKHSSNSVKLYDTAKKYSGAHYGAVCVGVCFSDTNDCGAAADFIADVCNKKNKKNKDVSVFVTAGASVPAEYVKRGVSVMAKKIRNYDIDEPTQITERTDEDRYFAEYIKSNLDTAKKIRVGSTATGKVIQITDTEIFIDIKGVKQTAYISSADYGLFEETPPEYGDIVECSVMSVDERIGEIRLSRRQFENTPGMRKIYDAFENGTPVTGNVFRAQQSGIYASVEGARVFIPPAYIGQPFGKPVEELNKTDITFKIINPYDKGRVIAAIKEPDKNTFDKEQTAKRNRERRAQAANFWEKAEPGQYYDGTVRNLAPYGAFVDLGVIDGLLHISELSWNRVSNPEDVIKPGETIRVYIKSLDEANRRVSLGYRDPAANPWIAFAAKHVPGDIVEGVISSIKTYGAFLRIDDEEIDALIHTAEISDELAANVFSAVKVGDRVKAKIIEINPDKQRINLTMRGLNGTLPVTPDPTTE